MAHQIKIDHLLRNTTLSVISEMLLCRTLQVNLFKDQPRIRQHQLRRDVD